jgi:hypothetical protein
MSAAGAPGPPRDPLSELLELASREGALEGESLAAFLEALGERSRLVLAERVERLEGRVRALETENGTLSSGLREASAAHEALLAHHRDVVERVAAEITAVAALSPLSLRQARRRLKSLAGLLRVDTR